MVNDMIEKSIDLLEKGAGSNRMPDFKIKHSYAVAETARAIAENSGLDGELAYVLGLLHDIGCHFNGGVQHPYIGYKYLKEAGFNDEIALICITHSFLNANPNMTADGLLVFPVSELENVKRESIDKNIQFNLEDYVSIDGYYVKRNSIIPWEDENEFKEMITILKTKAGRYSEYEEIVNLCDLMCTIENIGIEKRLIDLQERKGIHITTDEYSKRALGLKTKYESLMGKKMEELFPEILNKEHVDFSKIIEIEKKRK